MINFTELPNKKPGNSTSVSEGRHKAKVFKSEMRTSKTSNNEYLNVSYKLEEGGFVNENYFDSDKPFLQYKLSRLLLACEVSLQGEGTLEDIKKCISGKDVIVDVVINDNGYAALDYSGDKDGVYNLSELNDNEKTEEVELDPEVKEAIEATEDEDF